MKEFAVSSSMEPLKFKIGDDVFTAVAPDRLPGNVLVRYAETVNTGKLYDANVQFFNSVMDAESSELFKGRLDSLENPITLETMMRVVEWLVEQYSNLKSQDSTPSSATT